MPVHLERSDENVREIEALKALLGGEATGLDGLLDDLKYAARRAWLPRLLGRSVRRAWAFDRYDQRDHRWWPQGISTSADASDDELVGPAGRRRRVVVTTWYSHEVDGVNQGSRITVLDLDTLRYRHVLLVDPRLDDAGQLTLEPLRIHAGGIVWWGPWLHVAATSRGFVTVHLDDILRVEGDNERPDDFGVAEGRVHSFGHHFVLPVRYRWRAHADDKAERLRYSFLSIDKTAAPPQLVAGEYGRGSQSTRLARFELDPATRLPAVGEDGTSRPVGVDEGGVRQMQGAVVVEGRHHVSVSRGPWMPGSLFTGRPGALRERRWALPMGPEDLSWWASSDTLWTVTEHPRRRWVCEISRPRP